MADASAELAAELAALLGVDAVHDLHRLTGGASRVTWAFEAGGRSYVVQRSRPGGERPGGLAREGALLRAARAAGVPVAEVVHADRTTLVMERVEGETIARRILRDDAYRDARAVLTAQLGAAAARIHAIGADAVPGLEHLDPLVRYRDVLDTLGEPHPAFELGFRWLADHRPESPRTTVVHGDLRLGNVIVGPDGLRAVLDWELAHLGDPVEDLGWMCVRAWRFGGAGHVAGLGPLEELLAAYEAASGTAVDPAAVHWWEVMGTLTWGVMCIMQAASHLGGLTRSVELAAIGRRVCENEYDLLRLLRVEVPAPTPTGRPGEPVHGRPTAAELCEAVREFVERDVAPAVSGRLAFHARVAANALAIVERELLAGGSMAAEHARRLAELGVADEAELAARIRDGSMDDRIDAVRAAVAATVADRLAVANPGYAFTDPGATPA